MTDCDHCGASFDDEGAYLDHLAAEHADDLGRIEQRRVDSRTTDDGGIDAVPVALAAVLVAAVAVVAYVILFAGGSGGTGNTVNGFEVAQTPTSQPYQGTHFHGQLSMTVMDETVDFSRDEYQISNTRNDYFHFEGDGRWHGHATGVTLEYAMATLSIGVSDDSVTYEGTTYTADGDTTVSVTVDGEEVTPSEYVLEDGDTIRIVVESS